MIGHALLILLLIGLSEGQHCEDGQSNYSRIVYLEWRTVTKNQTHKEEYTEYSCCRGYAKVNNTCEKGCPEGMYGANCSENCSCPSFCHQVTGECICKAGFKGNNCSEECHTNTYGINCEYECNCENNSTCSPFDGSCNCTSPGWQGALCNKECTNSTYGLFCNESCTCNDNQTCDPVNGSCTCKPGWKGGNCSEECGEMKYGIDCSKNCTCNSTRTNYCDRKTGSCVCHPGYTNKDCSMGCRFGWYGQNCNNNCSVNCTNTPYCDPENGTCICIGTHGPNCTQECEIGKYGPNCVLDCECNNNSMDISCHNLTGQCNCTSGWTGRKCDRKCPFGTFGLNCYKNCSDSCTGTDHCDPVNGTCICIHKKGPNCSQEIQRNGTDAQKATQAISKFFEENMLAIIFAVIGLLLVMVAIVIAICWRRITVRRRLKKERESLDFNAKENPSYNTRETEEIPLDNDTGESKLHMYQDAVLETENQSELPSNNVTHSGDDVPRDTDDTHETENYDHAYSESNVVSESTEDEYSFPDKDTGVKKLENHGEQLKDGATHEQEELYDSTEDTIKTVENVPNEYNTFNDVLRIHKETDKKEVEPEEEYDVIASAGSQKKKSEHLEHYSSFEQVRKLSLQDAEEEDMYNELNEDLSKHKSAKVINDSYHHISLKCKTIDGEMFANADSILDSHGPKKSRSNKKLSIKQTSLVNSSIDEELEKDGKTDTMSEEKHAIKGGGIPEEEDLAEVIYDECDLDDDIEKPELEHGATDTNSQPRPESDMTEVVYEECDVSDKEESRPPSGAVYEDVDDDEEDSKEEKEEEKLTDDSNETENSERPRLKKRSERCREDYEDFAL